MWLSAQPCVGGFAVIFDDVMAVFWWRCQMVLFWWSGILVLWWCCFGAVCSVWWCFGALLAAFFLFSWCSGVSSSVLPVLWCILEVFWCWQLWQAPVPLSQRRCINILFVYIRLSLNKKIWLMTIHDYNLFKTKNSTLLRFRMVTAWPNGYHRVPLTHPSSKRPWLAKRYWMWSHDPKPTWSKPSQAG